MMKKEKLIVLALLTVASFKSYARTGRASDELEFLLAIIGLLIIALVLFSGIDYLKKNGKTIIHKSISFLNEKFTLLINHINRVKSH